MKQKIGKTFKEFLEELREGILNETLPMEFIRNERYGCLADVIVKLPFGEIKFSVHPKFIVYYHEVIRGYLDNDLEKVLEITKKHVHQFSEEELKQIQFHQNEIDRIRAGQTKQISK